MDLDLDLTNRLAAALLSSVGAGILVAIAVTNERFRARALGAAVTLGLWGVVLGAVD